MLANSRMPLAMQCLECGAPLADEGVEGFCLRCLSRLVFDPTLGDSKPPESRPRQILGDFELLEEIGRGGMGIVWRARQRSLDRIVAVKLVAGGPLAGHGLHERLRHEATTTARLQHPNIVTVFEAGEADGHAWLAMEFVPGRSAAELARHEPMAVHDAARLVVTIATAVHYAHSLGVIHRDLKPSNILVDASGIPRVTDFGLARDSSFEADLTSTGFAAGTPSFCAPEQLKPSGEGPAAHPVGATTDVYGLGAILYYLVTGRPPFVGSTLGDTLNAVVNDDPLSPRQLNAAIPRDLETICLKCLEKNPARRYPTAQSLADDLSSFVRGEPIQARPTSRLDRSIRWCKRKPALATTLGSVLCLGLALVVGSWFAAAAIWRERSRAEANLVRQYVDTGLRLGEAGETIDAFPWLAEALRRESSPYRKDLHQMRLAWHAMNLPVPELLLAPSNGITTAAWSPDGSYLAIGDTSGAARVYGLPGDPEPLAVVNHGARIGQVGFVADPPRLLTIGSPGDQAARHLDRLEVASEVRVWSIPNGELATRLVHPAPVSRLVTSHRFPRIAAVVPGHGLWLWDPIQYRILGVIGTNQVVQDAGFGTNHDTLFIVLSGGRVQRWHIGRTQLEWSVEHRGASRIGLNSGGDRLLVLGDDRGVHLLDSATGTSTGHFARSERINHTEFSPDGAWLLCASRRGIATIWEIQSGMAKQEIRYVGHPTDSVQEFTARWAPDGSQIVLVGNSGLRFIDTRTLQPTAPKRLGYTGVPIAEYSPSESRLLTIGLDSVVRVWGKPPAPSPTAVHPWIGPVDQMAVAPNGGAVAFSGNGGAQVLVNEQGIFTERFRASVHSDTFSTLTDVRFSPDGRFVLVADDGYLRLWDSHSGSPVTPPLEHSKTGVVQTRFLPDSSGWVCGGDDGTLTVWRMPSGRLERRLNQGSAIRSLEVSPNSNHALVGADTGGAQLWDLRSGTPAIPPMIHATPVLAVAIAGDGTVAATGDEGGTIRVWQAADGEDRCPPLRHFGYVATLAFSRDGRRLLSASADCLATVWDTSRGSVLVRLRHGDYVNAAAFSPDERMIATASEQGLRLWDAATGEALSPWLPSQPGFPQAWRTAFLPDGHFVLACGQYASNLTIRQIPRIRRTPADWLDLAAVVSGQQLAADGSLEVVAPGRVAEAYLRWKSSPHSDIP